MQFKTIKKTVADKMEDWLSSISDESLRIDVKANLLVSGGSICSLMLGENVNDYDVYLQDIDVLKRLTQYYVDPINGVQIWDGRERVSIPTVEPEVDDEDFAEDEEGNGYSHYLCSLRNLQPNQIKLFITNKMGGLKVDSALNNAKEGEEPKKYRVSYLSPNAISLTDDIQIVIRFHGTPLEIHKTFDFIHATNYFTFKDGLVTSINALQSIISKQLYYQGSLYPLTSVIRAKKFIKRNWNITAGEYLKMIFQCSLLDFTNLDVLEEQLIGVDVAYFNTLISELRTHKAENSEFKLSSEYLNTMIDRISNGEE